MRQINSKEIFDEKKITICGNNKNFCIILAQIYPIEVKLLVFKFDKRIEIDD